MAGRKLADAPPETPYLRSIGNSADRTPLMKAKVLDGQNNTQQQPGQKQLQQKHVGGAVIIKRPDYRQLKEKVAKKDGVLKLPNIPEQKQQDNQELNESEINFRNYANEARRQSIANKKLSNISSVKPNNEKQAEEVKEKLSDNSAKKNCSKAEHVLT